MPIEFEVTEGQVHDSQIGYELVSRLPEGGIVIADKGYDDDFFRLYIRVKGSMPVIPQRKYKGRKNKNIDWDIYKCRHLVENLFARLKNFRAIATRYDKLKRNFKSMLFLACSYFWLPL